MNTKILLTTIVAAAGLTLSSCTDDFLTQKNTTSPNPDGFFGRQGDVHLI